jgi:hypothetical protein
VSDDIPLAPFVYEGLDPPAAPKSRVKEAFETIGAAAHGVGDAIEAGRRPGMPLSILGNIVREAPLGSLLVAFMLGIAIGRRRIGSR